MKRKKPIARLIPGREKRAEIWVLGIGRIFSEAGITEKEAQDIKRELEGVFYKLAR